MKKFTKYIAIVLLSVCAIVGCHKKPSSDPVQVELDEAAGYLKEMYKDDLKTKAGNFEVVTVVKGHDITWTVTIKEGGLDVVKLGTPNAETKKVAIEVTYDLDTNTKDTPFILKGEIGKEGKTASVSFEYVVPAYHINTHEEYIAASAKDLLTVKGVVMAVLPPKGTKYNIYLKDVSEGLGYYIYSMDVPEDKKSDVEVGNTLIVSGEKDVYNGTHEIKNATYKVTSDAKVTSIAAKNIDNLFPATNFKGNPFIQHQGMFVEITGVKLINITDKYLNFEKDGAKSYIYLSSSECMASAEQQEALKAKMVYGYTATIKGIGGWYSDIGLQILPYDDDAITVTSMELTDEDKVAATELEIKGSFESSYNAPTEITLPTKGVANEDVTVEVSLVGGNTAWASVADGKLTLTPQDDSKTVELEVVATKGEKTNTFTVSFKVEPLVLTDIATIISEGKDYKVEGNADVKYYVKGRVVAHEAADNTKKTSFVLADNTAIIYVYASNKIVPAVGDEITLEAQYTAYSQSGTESVLPELDKVKVLEQVANTTDPIPAGKVTEVDYAALDTTKPNTYYGKLLKVTGKWIDASGEYYIGVDDDTAATAKFRAFTNYETVIAEALLEGDATVPADGTTVTIYAFCTGVTKNDDIYQMKTQLVSVGAEGAAAPERYIDFPALEPVTVNLTAANLFVGCTGGSYANYNGNHVVDGITFTTNQVLNSGVPSGFPSTEKNFMQFQASKGSISANMAVESVVLTVYATNQYPYDKNFTVTVGGTALTGVVETVETDLVGTNETYPKIMKYTVTFTLPDAKVGLLTIAKPAAGAGYVSEIVINPAPAAAE